MVGISLGTMSILMIDKGEGDLFGLSLRLTLEYPLESPNTGLTGIIIGMSLGNTIVFLRESI